MRTEVLCISVLRVASRPRVKLAGRKSALTPPVVLFNWPFKGGGPGVSPTLCCFVLYSTRRFVLSLALRYFLIVVFNAFSISITSLMVLVWFCLFPLPLRVWDWLRRVIVALPGVISYLFLLTWNDLNGTSTKTIIQTRNCSRSTAMEWLTVKLMVNTKTDGQL